MALKKSKENKFGRVGVLMGGPSSEREISLKSGKAVYAALKESGIEVSAIDIQTDNVEENIRLLKSKKIDCAFLALHGRFGEDGSMQQILEDIKIPYTGSGVSASRLAMDKIASRKIFQDHGLKVPQYEVVKGNADWEMDSDFVFPLVVKPATHGSSIGLSIVDKKEYLEEAVNLAFSFDHKVIIEEYIEGREVTVGILEEKPLAVIEIISKRRFFDYEAKYQAGMTDYIVPAKIEKKLSGKIQDIALLAHKLLGCSGCSRVDIILDKYNIPFVLEVNTIPGMTETSLLPKAAKIEGISFNALCIKLIRLAYEKK
ncbi:MAG: D-alanine--D-alanine ligase [Candidatus Omnitrophica bacterium]|nr:D-alanine--D-alanine ligase [Candidatus Omnitrophota bacterium]